jgi:hypothetical protein
MLSECRGLRVVVASESSAGGLKNALPTGWWLALERSGRASGSRCGVARNRREQIDSHQECPSWHHHWLSHEEGFVFIIGIDPDKGSHTAAVLDRTETVIGELRVCADRRQRDQLLGFTASFTPRTWASEAASGLGALLPQQLVAAGETGA